jgi:hypothetical protein
MRQNGKVHFPIQKQLVKDHILFILAKTMDRYVLPILAQCDTTTMAFNLWMSWTNFDTFALIMNFLNREWVPCHVINGLFEAPNTSGVALVEIIKLFFGKIQVDKQGNHLSKIRRQEPSYFKFFLIKCCFLWGISIGNTIFQGCVLDMWCPKMCWYATNEDVVCQGVKEISLKEAQSTL